MKKIGKLLCWFGLHDWKYLGYRGQHNTYHGCNRCNHVELEDMR